jgi:hypothetical protein
VNVNDTVSMWQSSRRRQAERSGVEGCLSDLTLDRLTLNECSPQEREQAQAHLAGCRACTEALAAIAADHGRFPQEADIPALALDALARAQAGAAGGVRARWLRWLAPAMGLGLAAAGLLLWTRPAGDDLRAKGGFAVELFVKHAETPGDGKLHTGEALHPGDRVRLRLSGAAESAAAKREVTPGDEAAGGGAKREAVPSGEAAGGGARRGAAPAGGAQPSFVAVLAVDTTGRVSVYHPASGTTATPADPAGTPLPGAVELDGTLGTEVILAFSCPSPVAIETLTSAVQQATDRARVAGDPAAAVGPMQTPCAVARYRIEKAAPAANP